MKDSISLHIPSPCAEQWASFTPTPAGGFCASCSKTVIDFTNMSDDEIVAYFAGNRAHTCGRFRPGQLKTYSQTAAPSVRPGFMLFKAGLLSLLLVLINKQQVSAQGMSVKPGVEVVQYPAGREAEKTVNAARVVKGVVVSVEDGGPLPGVNIYLKGSDKGTVSDADGQFEFPGALKAGDVLVFSFIGYLSKEYVVPAAGEEIIEIQMTFEYCDIMIMGAVAVDDVYSENRSVFGKWWQKVRAWF